MKFYENDYVVNPRNHFFVFLFLKNKSIPLENRKSMIAP